MHDFTPSLEQNHIPPNTAQLSDALTRSHFTESKQLVQCDAGIVFGKDSSLQRPYPRAFRVLYEFS